MPVIWQVPRAPTVDQLNSACDATNIGTIAGTMGAYTLGDIGNYVAGGTSSPTPQQVLQQAEWMDHISTAATSLQNTSPTVYDTLTGIISYALTQDPPIPMYFTFAPQARWSVNLVEGSAGFEIDVKGPKIPPSR